MNHLKNTFPGISLTPLLVVLVFLISTTNALAITGDLTDDFQFPDYPAWKFCPVDTKSTQDGDCGDTAAVFADVDGINNGGTYGIYDTMVVISTVRGEMYRITLSGSDRALFYSFFEVSCEESNCSVDNTCDKGRLVMQFVDLTDPGVVWDNPSTWTFKRVPYVEFYMSSDFCYDYDDPKFENMPAYKQARAYRTIPLTDIIGSCDLPEYAYDIALIGNMAYVTDGFSAKT